MLYFIDTLNRIKSILDNTNAKNKAQTNLMGSKPRNNIDTIEDTKKNKIIFENAQFFFISTFKFKTTTINPKISCIKKPVSQIFNTEKYGAITNNIKVIFFEKL